MIRTQAIKKEVLISKEQKVPENFDAYKDNLKNVKTLNEFTENFTNIETYYEETNSTSEAVVDVFSKNRFRSVKYQIQITNDTSHHTTEILLVHDGVVVYLTEYGTILTDESLATFSSGIVGNNVRLLATPALGTTTKFKIIRTGINT